MSSQVNPTVIKDGQRVRKQDLRDQLGIIASEISALQAQGTQCIESVQDIDYRNQVILTSTAYLIAYGGQGQLQGV